MKKSEILELVKLLQKEVDNLKGEIATLKIALANKANVYIPFIQSTNHIDLCTDGTHCEYPNPWHATIPPHCKKCNKQGKSYTITCTNSVKTNS